MAGGFKDAIRQAGIALSSPVRLGQFAELVIRLLLLEIGEATQPLGTTVIRLALT